MSYRMTKEDKAYVVRRLLLTSNQCLTNADLCRAWHEAWFTAPKSHIGYLYQVGTDGAASHIFRMVRKIKAGEAALHPAYK